MTTLEYEISQCADVTIPEIDAKLPSITEVGIVTVGVALAATVGVHGPAPWPALRELVALAATAAVLDW